jgi:hypothetical protein
VRPEELDAIITSGGNSSSSCRYSFFLKSIRSGPFSWTRSAPLTAVLERQFGLGCPGAKAQPLECRPRRFDEPLQGGFCIRRDIGRHDLQAVREEEGGPARANDASADDGDAANGLGRHGQFSFG